MRVSTILLIRLTGRLGEQTHIFNWLHHAKKITEVRTGIFKVEMSERLTPFSAQPSRLVVAALSSTSKLQGQRAECGVADLDLNLAAAQAWTWLLRFLRVGRRLLISARRCEPIRVYHVDRDSWTARAPGVQSVAKAEMI